MSEAITSAVLHQKHVSAVSRKYERIGGLGAILETWLMPDCPYKDWDYVRDLKKRIRGLHVNLSAMRPGKEKMIDMILSNAYCKRDGLL